MLFRVKDLLFVQVTGGLRRHQEYPSESNAQSTRRMWGLVTSCRVRRSEVVGTDTEVPRVSARRDGR